MECRECGAMLAATAKFCSECGWRVQAAPDPKVDPLKEALEKSIGFQYRIERLLGRGGMGAVYLAHELALDRDVAIKVLPPDQAGAPQLRDRFRREARIAARLNHPYIVPLYTFGEVDGLVYFVMGYITGESLAARLKRQERLEAEEARTLLVHISDALDYAHRQGVVHRDIKPDNILIDEASGFPMLTDFGIARATLTDTQLTTTGQMMGTPDYMSPEQVSGNSEVGPASDLYSLGIVAYEILSGQLPFEAKSPMDAMTRRLTQAPRQLRSVAPDISDDLIVAVNGCLHKEPGTRWPDAKSLRAALSPMDEESDDGIPGRFLRGGHGTPSVVTAYACVPGGFYFASPGSSSARQVQRNAFRDLHLGTFHAARWRCSVVASGSGCQNHLFQGAAAAPMVAAMVPQTISPAWRHLGSPSCTDPPVPDLVGYHRGLCVCGVPAFVPRSDCLRR
jgi:serine/threonine protein kinase